LPEYWGKWRPAERGRLPELLLAYAMCRGSPVTENLSIAQGPSVAQRAEKAGDWAAMPLLDGLGSGAD
jgi:hypothetical protein